jgi:hypothetical protein
MKFCYIVAFMFFLGFDHHGFGQTLVETIPLPATTYWNSAYGLVYANSKYWISSGSSTAGRGVFYGVDSAGNIVDSVRITNYPGLRESQGLAFDGTNFWYVERKTARCDLFEISPSGLVLDSIPIASVGGTTSWLLGGAAWDGSGLWVSLYSPDASAALYKIDVAARQIIDTIPVLQLQPTGITVKGDTLFYANDGFQGVDKIYAVSMNTKDTLFSFNPPEQPGQRQNPRGLAWDGAHFWLLAEPVGASSGRALFKYDMGGSGTPVVNVPVRFFDYGRIRLGNAQQVTAAIQNIGTANLRIDSVRILYSNQFTTNLTTPLMIPPGGNQNFTMTFTPTVYGADSAHVVLYHNDPARQPQVIRNIAMGIYPTSYIVTPSSHGFGTRRVNSTNLWTLTIQNHGALPFTVDSISFGIPQLYLEPGSLPLTVDSVNSRSVRVWFRPSSHNNFADTMRIHSNAANVAIVPIHLTGTGDSTSIPLGGIMWEGAVPDNPFTNFDDYQTKSIKEISDVNGDGANDVIVASGNYLVTCFNGGSSVSGDILWVFNTGTNNNNTGSVDWEDALQIRDDVDGDGVQDVVFGCAGGNEFVYTVSGRTGQPIWAFGDSTNPGLGDIIGVRADRDYNGDGVKDVLVSASGVTDFGGRHAVICLNGLNGQVIFNQQLPYNFTYDVVSTQVGGAIGAGNNGGPYAILGFNMQGQTLWSYNLSGTLNATWSLKEIPDISGDGITNVVALYGFNGNTVALSADAGVQQWITSLGPSNNGKIILLDDLNGNGYPDLAASAPQSVIRFDSKTGLTLWLTALSSSYIRGIDYLSDVSGDGARDIAVATQQPGKIVVLSGMNGNVLFEYLFGTNIAQRGDRVATLLSIDGNKSTEFVGGNREGRVVCFSGGVNTVVGVIPSPELPKDFSVSQNYPNPFNPSTTIEVGLPSQQNLTVKIFDVLGRELRSFYYEKASAGVHKIVWDGRNQHGSPVASGVYFYRVQAGDTFAVRRMLLLK